ncbi:MAG: Cpeb2p [Marteilia pararefringens]
MNFFPQNPSDPNECIDSLQESITSNTSIGSSIVFRVREDHSNTRNTSNDNEGELKSGLEQQLDKIWPDGPLFHLNSSLLQKSCFELSPEERFDNYWQNEEKPVNCLPQIQNSISEEIAERIYSRKIFVGGLPSQLSQEDILIVFSIFGPHRVDWPYKKSLLSSIPPKGYCFLIFEEEVSIMRLLSKCVQEKQSYFYFIPLLDGSMKKVQIRPWLISNRIYLEQKHHQTLSLCYSNQHIKSIMSMRPKEIEKILNLDVKSILFVGGVPRPTTAYDLSIALSKRFGPVGYVALSTDSEYNYPKGSGKVLFLDRNAYQEAYKHRYIFVTHISFINNIYSTLICKSIYIYMYNSFIESKMYIIFK